MSTARGIVPTDATPMGVCYDEDALPTGAAHERRRTTSQEKCEEDWSSTWDLDCPDPSPGDCNALAPSDSDPSCTGPPKAIDRFGLCGNQPVYEL